MKNLMDQFYRTNICIIHCLVESVQAKCIELFLSDASITSVKYASPSGIGCAFHRTSI